MASPFPWKKSLYGGLLSLLLGFTAYGVYFYLERKKSRFKDEGFEDLSRIEDLPEKRILVLGLDGAGKSTFLANLSKVENGCRTDVKPTEGFNILCMHTDDSVINIWEIGGKDTVRPYWNNFFHDTDVVVFVVDSCDGKRFQIACDEFQKVLADERLKSAPVLVLANKQDKMEASSINEIEAALRLRDVSPKVRKVYIKGMQVSPTKPQHRSVREAEDFMIHLAYNG